MYNNGMVEKKMEGRCSIMTMPKRKTLSVEEAAPYLKIKPTTLQNWIYSNRHGIRSLVRKIGGPPLFFEDEFIKWIDSHRLEEKTDETPD